jgi:hypothetical protein
MSSCATNHAPLHRVCQSDRRCDELEKLATACIGDGKQPDLFFVSRKGNVQLVTTDFDLAYSVWRQSPSMVESALENRTYGVICSSEPEAYASSKLLWRDESRQFLDSRHCRKKTARRQSEQHGAPGKNALDCG